MFDKILIANRGEIACRIARTARRLGVRTVAVYSDADARSRHVAECDEAVRIGPAPARESYLRSDAIVDAALRTGAQALHPGYGFLSENAEFAEACARAGLVFIGPPPGAMRAMGSKSAAKSLMEEAGVPLTPGYHGERQEPDYLARAAEAIGYPVLIKASAGGGGKGMRRVDRAEDFAAALEGCRREARASFGDDRVLVERYVLRPRHVEMQIFADAHDHCVHLFERDCSVQRRHQKVLEEAPAPGMTAERRAQMGEAAIAAARAVGYVGAGTVEFIVAPDGSFYFMEMNTRLQVEHPVTEMITGVDLVEWQLRIASGEALPLVQEQLRVRGHALEARIYAEDPERGFLPATGALQHLATPAASMHVRVDAGVASGSEITPFYDPMIAKLIVWDDSRERALGRMQQALAEFRIVGVANNVEFLSRLVASPAFASADLDTALIEREHDFLFPPAKAAPSDVWLVAAVATHLREREHRRRIAATSTDPHSPWHAQGGWRLNGESSRRLVFREREIERRVGVGERRGAIELRLEDEPAVTVRADLVGDSELRIDLGGRLLDATVVVAGERRHVFFDGRTWLLTRVDPLHFEVDAAAGGGGLRAPMPGRVVALLATPDNQVKKGAPLLVVEAMKMEHTITAPSDGTVRAFHVAVGEQVTEGAELVDFEATA